MANIIGTPFASFVKGQVIQRQTILGASNLSADDLKFITTKTPWLRLASSVNLTGKMKVKTNEDGSKTEIFDDSVLGKLINAGVDKNSIVGDNLAKNFILQGGSISLNENKNEYSGTESNNAASAESVFRLKKGLNYGNDNIFNGAYGWGGTSERGFVPMPGIESSSTTYYNNGALSKTTVTIKCFSKAQFQLLDVLYLRPGYSLLLEFGWSSFVNNIGMLQNFPGFKTTPLSFLLDPSTFPGDQNQFQMYSLIEAERKKYSGNYEAVYGKVTNFKWSFSSDGSYTCTVDIIGMGSVIESLKLNVTDPVRNNTRENKPDDDGIDSFKEWLASFFNQKIATELYVMSTFTEDEYAVIRAASTEGSVTFLNEKSTKQEIVDWAKPKYDEYVQKIEAENQITMKNKNSNPLLKNKDATALNKTFFNIYQKFASKNTAVGWNTAFGVSKGAFTLGTTFNGEQLKGGGDKTMESVYVKFGVLLKIIEKKCNLFSKKGEENGTPTIKFDFQYNNLAKDRNYMLIIPPNLSTNPRKCIVPWKHMTIPGILNFKGTVDGDLPQQEWNEADKKGWSLNAWLYKSNFLLKDNPYVGRLGNVLINLRFAADALETAPRDEDGAISVLGYIQTILEGIAECMGSINKFKVTVDDNDGLTKIYDESPIPGLKTIEDRFTKFNIFGIKTPLQAGENTDTIGVTNQQASFITNLELNAEIPKNFATMIAIGAQSSGNNLQGNSTSFSNYNKGLIDRIIPEKLDFVELKEKDEKVDDKVGNHPVKIARNIKMEKLYYLEDNNKISPFDAIYSRKGNSLGNMAYYDFSPAVTEDFTENYTTYIKLIQGILTDNNKVPQPFFLPFNLSLEMEGLSGMKLFQKFRITDDILPPSYEKDSVDIIVKGINHNVNINTWSTTLSTLSVPRFKEEIVADEPIINEVENKNETQQKVENANKEKVIGPEEDKVLRLRLTRLNDDGYQTFGLMEVLDNNGDLLYALATVELPWRDNQNGNSCIPLGTYDLSYRNSPQHGDCFIIVDEGTPQTGNVDEPYKGGFGIYGNPNKTTRGLVLIHKATAARFNDGRNILKGCIAPGLHFNTNQNIDSTGKSDKNGNPRGLGPQHGTPNASKSGIDTKAAVAQLLGTLKETGINPGFKMEITALDPENGKPMNEWFYDDEPQEFIAEVEAKTGAKYTYLT